MKNGGLRNLALGGAATLLAAAPAPAADMFIDEARVIDSQPVYETREAPVRVQQCGYDQQGTSAAVDPAILGDARALDPPADLIGSLQTEVELREPPPAIYRCRMVTRMEQQSAPAGYRVRYEYDGRMYEHRVTEPPGETIRVRVEFSVGQHESAQQPGRDGTYAATR